MSLLQRVAQTPTIVLLEGESGVGKEKVAHYLHHYSNRSHAPFVVVDCGALGENLIESELFGHQKGSFTGANRLKQGLFEAAQGGSLFIDEIGDLPLVLQTKLLRVLETGKIRRLGGTRYHEVDVRVIAATHRDLRSIVRQGSFREDLYYGLAAFPVRVPTLRERKDDIPLLTEHFLEHMQDGENSLPLSPVVFDDLESRNEEMETIRETATGGHLYLKRRGRVSQGELLETLNACSGHRAEAARRLGISERTLYRRYGVLPLAAYDCQGWRECRYCRSIYLPVRPWTSPLRRPASRGILSVHGHKKRVITRLSPLKLRLLPEIDQLQSRIIY